MGKKQDSRTKTSKFLSLVLRHRPEAAGIRLDEHGWANVSELLKGVNRAGRALDLAQLEEIVRTDAKGRYSFNENHTKIRANQGHSVTVDVDLKQETPPDILYHGTASRFLNAILERGEGLKPMSRLYVHLSADDETAVQVGIRHGSPAVLEIAAGRMKSDGYLFYLSENGVWLTKAVPREYLRRIERINK